VNAVINRSTQFINLGQKDYKESWDYQISLFDQILATKSENRALPSDQQKPTPNYLLFVEHPHVFTLGKSGDENNLLVPQQDLHTIQASYYPINRGGDITYHGPGQLVGYPVLDLENFFTDIHKYMRLLEESIIQTLKSYGIDSGRIAGLTGVWLNHNDEKNARKICALGVKTSRWVTQHGFAFNVNTNLRYFDYIVPCGITDKAVTSMELELGKKQDMHEVSARLKKSIAEQFGMELI
jgi:lipoyl(octanoyl) transferase